MNCEGILVEIRRYYSTKIKEYGPTAKGVDWNSNASQKLRFEQLLKICNPNKVFSINDYGCGYGALVNFIIDNGYVFKYRGFDISESMIENAVRLHSKNKCCQFSTMESFLKKSDYTVASGLFNVKLTMSIKDWERYVLTILDKINNLSRKGFAFNMLTTYSDKNHMRKDLYYADPCFMFNYSKRYFSKNVALLHDYGLYEFTLLVRK